MPNPFQVADTNDTFTYNGPIREIEVGAGTSTFDIQKVYSFWKQWVVEGNAQYLPAWRPVGGDDLGGDNAVAFYGFLSNGWRVRLPQSVDNLFVTGGILSTDELDNPFRFDGALVTLQQPVSVQFVTAVKTDQIIDDIARFRALAEFVIAPELYYLRNTVEKTIAPSVLSVVSDLDFVEYDNNTGITTLRTTAAAHNLEVDDRVHLVGVAMTCVETGGNTLVIFPDIELGSGTYPNPGDVTQPFVFTVLDVPQPNEVVIQVGVSSLTHVYTSGGILSRFQADLINNQFGLPTNTIPPKTSDQTALEKIIATEENIVGIGTSLQITLAEVLELEQDLVSIANTNQQLNETLIGVGTDITTTLDLIIDLEQDLISIANTNQQLNETLIGVGETITTVLDQVLALEQDILTTEQQILVGIGTNQTILNANTTKLQVIDNNTKLIPGII